MAELTIKSRILFRDDTAANWSTTNPILKNGEPGWDSTNYRLKIGNDVNAWSDLKWATPNVDIYTDSGIEGANTFYVKGGSTKTIFSDTAVYPDVASNLGSSSKKWKTIYSETIDTGNILTTGKLLANESSFSIEVNTSSAGITIDYNSVYPNRNSEISLGKFGFAFSTIFSKNLIMNYPAIDNTNTDYLSMDGNIIYTGDISANLTFVTLKSFKITGYDYEAKTFTLDSVSELSVGDTYSTACAESLYYDYGTITNISGTTVTVSTIPSGSFGSFLNSSPQYNHMCWFIKNKPKAGTTVLSSFEIGKSNFIMVNEPKISSGMSYFDKNYFNRSNFFAFGKGLIIPVNSNYSNYPCFKIGKYDNDSSGNYPFLIGWGSSDTARKNIFYINTSGQAYAGSVYPNTSVGSTTYLGSSSNLWDKIYGDNIIGNLFRPSSDGADYIGNSSYHFAYGYINTLYVDMLSSTTSSAHIGSGATHFDYGYIDTVYLNNNWATLPSTTTQRALSYKNYGTTSVGDIDAITTPGLYTLRTGITGGPYCSNTGSGGSVASSYFTVLCMATDSSSSYRPMIGIKENDNNLYVKGSTGGAWKRIGWGYGTAAPSGTANTGDIYIQYES